MRLARPRLETLPHDPDLESALDAMTPGELRAFLRDALERLEEGARTALVDRLIAHAAAGRSGWRPSRPSRRIVDDVERFAAAARRTGYAEPHAVDGFLRQGTKAFLAGDPETARRVFEALLPPVVAGDVHVGQHEMVDEVLTVSVPDCALQHLASVYSTSSLEERAGSLGKALAAVHGAGWFSTPLEQMERVMTEPLPELDEFLPRWMKYLEEQPCSEGDWESERDRWLREAAFRLEGVAGLERIALETRKPEALRAWCRALVERGDWSLALRAYDEAAKLVVEAHWRGDFLDGSALAARQLRRRDSTIRLEAAWLGAPSLVRLLRWLGAGNPSAADTVKRARKAIGRCHEKSGAQLGVLHLLTGNVRAAARLLARAPGLGWSGEGHPGHILFASFAGLLAEGRSRARLLAILETPGDPRRIDLDSDLYADHGEPPKPVLGAPSIAELMAKALPAANLETRDQLAMLESMQTAAKKRVEGVLENKRRGHYAHAATLAACCLELAPIVGRRKVVAQWVDDMRKEHKRFHAFHREFESVVSRLSVN